MKVVIQIQNDWSYIEDYMGLDSQVADRIKRVCSIQYSYMTKRKGDRHPTKKTRVVPYCTGGKFPSGLLPRVAQELKQSGIDVTYKDGRVKPDHDRIETLKLTLPPLLTTDADYSFQEDAVEAALKFGRGLLHYPTGAGKTVIMARIIDRLKLPTLVIVPNLTLLNQTFEKFQQYFGADFVGKIGEGEKEGWMSIITVATQQSLHSMMKRDRVTFDALGQTHPVLMLDECHHVATGSPWTKDKEGKWVQKADIANTWYQVAMALPCYHRYGFSATMNTSDSPNNQFVLEAVTGRIVASISVSELIERKVLCPVEVTMIRMAHQRYGIWKDRYKTVKKNGKKVKELVEDGAYDQNIIGNVNRNQMIADLAAELNAQGYRVLVQVDLVAKHGNKIKARLPNAVFLHGQSSKQTRKDGIAEVKQDNKILIGTIFKEGFDMPEIDAMIIAGGGKSEKMLIQRVGRVLRVHPEKNRALVFDFYDDDNGSMCTRHSDTRLGIYQDEDQYKVRVVNSVEEALDERHAVAI